MATIHTFAADLSSRIPEMARDSQLNNQKIVENLLREFLDSTRCSPPSDIPESELPTLAEMQEIYRQYK